MNYKKIIRNKKVRLKILKMLDFIPDKIMIYIQYYISTGRILNLSKAERFTEKLQWYKLYYRDPMMTKCVDKYDVRAYIKSKELEEILIPIHGVYNSANEINFKELPNSFILKTTNGSQTNIISRDKKSLNIKETRNTLDNWLSSWKGKMGREWAYYNSKGKIICEELLITEDISLIDYKFFCFNGKTNYLYVVSDRGSKEGHYLSICDTNFNNLYESRANKNHKFEKPENFDTMIKIAEKLSKDFPHVRVDLYNIKGKIYFGELTFYNASGYKSLLPNEYDLIFGKEFIIPEKRIENE